MTEPSRTQLVAFQQRSEAFYSRFIRVGAAGLGMMAAFFVLLGIWNKSPLMIVPSAVALAVNTTAYVLTLRGRGLLGRRLFVYALLVNVTLATLFSPSPDGRGFAIYVVIAILATTVGGFTLNRIDQLISAIGSAGMLAIALGRVILAEGWSADVLHSDLPTCALLLVLMLAITLFTSHSRANQRDLHTYVAEVDRVMTHAERIAKGDLAATVEGDSDVSRTIGVMLEGLRTMVLRTRDAASALASSAEEIAAMSRQQEHGAVEQASAVAQVHKTLAKLLEGSSHAAQSTEEVFRNVELTQKTSEVVAQRAATLSAHTRRISALLEIIKSIANKSEILALNAALEGARAGEAGRGFSLVASQMQKLAESVMDSVRDVRALIEDIEAATSATLSATEESTKLSSKATSAARQISVTLQQQRGSTEQVATAMLDIQQVTTQVSAGSTQSLSATRDLTRLAGELKRAIEGFQL